MSAHGIHGASTAIPKADQAAPTTAPVKERASPQPRPAMSGAWSSVLLSMLVTGGLYALHFIQNRRFYFVDDRVGDALPKLMDIGRSVSAGEWPWLTTDAVNSGAHAIEYQNAVFNPLMVALSVPLSRMHDIALGSFLVVLVHALLLAAAAAWLGRLLGLRAAWAVAFAVSCAFQPYTVLWGAAAWLQAVSSFAWFVLAVAAAVAFHTRPRRRYGWTLLLATYGCFTSGWPLAIPVLGLFVLVVVAARLYDRSNLRTTAWLVAWSGGGAVCSLIALYPLTRAFEFATRASSITNGANFNVGSVDGLLQFANPSYYGFLNNFAGYELVKFPHHYAAWFVLPVLAFWQAGRLASGAATLLRIGLAMFAVAALATLGPERLMVFRFPTRFLQYSTFFLLVATAVLIASGRFSFTARRLRLVLAALALTALTSLQADPTGSVRVVLFLSGTGALTFAFYTCGRHGDERPAFGTTSWRTTGDVVAALGTIAVLLAVALVHPEGRGYDYRFPSEVSKVPRLSRQDYTLFYGSYVPEQLEDAAGFYAEYHPSGTGLMVGDRQINGYSPIGHSAFREHFPIDDQGNFAPGGAWRFERFDPGTGLQMLELLRVDQIIAQQGPWTEDLERGLGVRWEREGIHRYTSVWRHAPYELPGLVSYVSPGVGVGDQPGCRQRHLRECVPLTTAADSEGRVIFARLWFPGYSATFDGKPLRVDSYSNTLVSVVVPPGSSGELVITYRSPHVRKLALLSGMVVLGLAVASFRYGPTSGPPGVRPRRRPRRSARVAPVDA